MRGAIVLAGGSSTRMGEAKPLLRVGGRTLLARVLDVANATVDEVVVVSRGAVAKEIAQAFPGVRVTRDSARIRTPLVGLEAGARAVRSAYVAALPCDLPFLERRVVEELFDLARNRDGAIPFWPDGRIEPLVAVYRRAALLAAVRASLAAGERANQAMVRRLHRVRFVPVDALRGVDRELRSLLNVNTPQDLARARRLSRSSR